MFCVPAHIDSHTMYSCNTYVHCATHVLEIGHDQIKGHKASSNKLNTLMTLQCNTIVACNVNDFKKI